MFHCENTSLSLSHLTHFACDPSARPRLKLSILLMSLLGSDISEESLNHSFNWSGGSICSAESGVLIETRVREARLEISSGVLETRIDLLSKVILLITGSCIIFDSKSIQFLKVLVCLFLKCLLVRGPFCQHFIKSMKLNLHAPTPSLSGLHL